MTREFIINIFNTYTVLTPTLALGCTHAHTHSFSPHAHTHTRTYARTVQFAHNSSFHARTHAHTHARTAITNYNRHTSSTRLYDVERESLVEKRQKLTFCLISTQPKNWSTMKRVSRGDSHLLPPTPRPKRQKCGKCGRNGSSKKLVHEKKERATPTQHRPAQRASLAQRG